MTFLGWIICITFNMLIKNIQILKWWRCYENLQKEAKQRKHWNTPKNKQWSSLNVIFDPAQILNWVLSKKKEEKKKKTQWKLTKKGSISLFVKLHLEEWKKGENTLWRITNFLYFSVLFISAKTLQPHIAQMCLCTKQVCMRTFTRKPWEGGNLQRIRHASA